MDTEKRVWGIHTRDAALFLNKNVMAIGWSELGDLSEISADREAFRKKMADAFPDAKKQAIATNTGQVYRFVHEVQVGDYVVFPSKKDRMINIGVVEGDYTYSPDTYDYVNQRKVKWLKHLPRTSFSQGALYEVGSAMTLFMIKNYSDEYLSALDKGFKGVIDSGDSEDDSIGATAEDIKDSTKDFILKELSKQLKGYDLENFVANLMEAMGYKPDVSQRGGDSGIDIVAYKDEFPPRIVVQVKSNDGNIKETTIQSLKGAMSPGDYGVFVTLSDYTKNAKAFIEKNPIIRGINGSELVDLVLKYYDKLSEKYRKMIPLEMVYIPVPKEEE